MQRKIIPDAENRLLILYALKTVGAMTDQQLLIVMTDTDLMNYITLQLKARANCAVRATQPAGRSN